MWFGVSSVDVEGCLSFCENACYVDVGTQEHVYYLRLCEDEEYGVFCAESGERLAIWVMESCFDVQVGWIGKRVTGILLRILV